MTKKILIDEAVVKQALEALEPLTISAELRGDSFPEGNELHRMADAGFKAITDLREALEVNNKGVNATEPAAWGLGNTAITGSNRWMMLREQVPADDQYGGAMWTPLYAHPAPTQQDGTKEAKALALLQEFMLKARNVVKHLDTIARACEAEQATATDVPKRKPATHRKPLTDEQCDAIYTALDEWCHEVDSYDFGLPAFAGGGMEKGREIIRAALDTTSNKGD